MFIDCRGLAGSFDSRCEWFAVAGGIELLLCRDILIAAEHAEIGGGHSRYGIVSAGGGTVRLMEKLSPSHASQFFYTADLVKAETLRDWGKLRCGQFHPLP